jgi:hypothetical protein
MSTTGCYHQCLRTSLEVKQPIKCPAVLLDNGFSGDRIDNVRGVDVAYGANLLNSTNF